MKWVEAFPVKACTALATTKILITDVFTHWGMPSVMESKQYPHFIGEITKIMCKVFNIDQRLHIAYHPQSLELVERTNCTIKSYCRQWKRLGGEITLDTKGNRDTVAAHGYTSHLANIGSEMRMPKEQFVQNQVPNKFSPMMFNDKWIDVMLNQIKKIQLQVAYALGCNQKIMMKSFGLFQVIEWE